MAKKNKTIFGIFIEAIGLYFSNFAKFLQYMTFPVLGQLFGLVITLSAVYWYSKFLPILISNYPVMNNFSSLIICSIIVTLPGLILLLKAFWEYIVAYGAINSMFENMIKSGKVYDFDAHTELIKRRSIPFIALWLLVGIFLLIGINPLFWVPAGVLAVYFILVFQVFTFEPELSPVGCAKKSLQLIRGHFATTFVFILLLGLLTYYIVPQIVNMLSEFVGLTLFLENLVKPLVVQLPFNLIEEFFAKYNLTIQITSLLPKLVVTQFISLVFIQYSLPLRSIACCLLYKNLNGKIGKTEHTKTTRTKQKKSSSEILMEKSHEKFVTQKLDKNILRRAMEKDDSQNEDN